MGVRTAPWAVLLAMAVTIRVSWAAPKITSVEPSHGPTSGQFAVTVTGHNFGIDESDIESVTLGNAPCTGILMIELDSKFTCRLGGGSGEGIEVFSSSGQLGSAGAEVFAFDLPAINSVSLQDCHEQETCSGASTAGGAIVTLKGSNFDSTFKGETHNVEVAYGDENLDCHVVTASTEEIVCSISEGSGNELLFTVTNRGPGHPHSDPQHDQVSLSYAAPVLQSIEIEFCQGATICTYLDTAGGDRVTIKGEYFDPSGDVEVSYGRKEDEFTLYPCDLVSHSFSEIVCKLAAGSGEELVFKVVNPGNGHPTNQPEEENIRISYAPPSVKSITFGRHCIEERDCEEFSSAGGEIVTVYGRTFDSNYVRVTYGVEADDYQNYECHVITTTTKEIVCTMASGSGHDLAIRVENQGPGKQHNKPDKNTVLVGYRRPVVQAISHDFCVKASRCTYLSTSGGQKVTLHGESFASEVKVTYGHYEDDYSRYICEVVSNTNSDITCELAPGSGTHQVFSVTNIGVNNIRNDPAVDLVSVEYSPPTAKSLSVDGRCDKSSTCSGVSTNGGELVTVIGSNFDGNGRVEVHFGHEGDYREYECAVQSSDLESITCILPAGSGTDYRILVTNLGPDLQSNSPSHDEVAFTYAAPSISAVSARSLDCDNANSCEGLGTEGGELITLIGSNFDPTSVKRVHVTYGSASAYRRYSCQVQSVSNEQVVCLTSPGSGDSLILFLENDGPEIQSSGVAHGITISYKRPRVAAITLGDTCKGKQSCSGASTAGGEALTITGTDFDEANGATVTYGLAPTYNTFPCEMVSLTTSEIVCTLSEGSGLDLGILVTNHGPSDTPSIPSTDKVQLSYGGPAISSVEFMEYSGVHTTGMDTAGAQRITLHGNNFDERENGKRMHVHYGPESNVRMFKCSIKEVTVSTIECLTEPGSGKNYRFVVTGDGGYATDPTTDVVEISYGNPVVTSVSVGTSCVNKHSCKSLSPDGGEVMTVSGKNFDATGRFGTLKVVYGMVGNDPSTFFDCSVVGVTPTNIKCQTSPASGFDLTIQVTNPGPDAQQSTFTEDDVYVSYASPEITSLSVSSRCQFAQDCTDLNTAGGEMLTVLGRHFDGELGALVTYGPKDDDAKVPFAMYDCVVKKVTTTKIECETEAGSGTDLVVKIVNNGAGRPTSDMKDDLFTLSYGAPAVDSVSVQDRCFDSPLCDYMVTKGGEDVTIHGQNFDASDGVMRVLVTYGSPEDELPFSRNECVLRSVRSDEIICTTTEGSGENLLFKVVNTGPNAGSNDPEADHVGLSYQDPKIDSVTFEKCEGQSSCVGFYTSGDQVVTLTGSNFDPDRARVKITYGLEDDAPVPFSMYTCEVTKSSFDSVECVTEQGSGDNLFFRAQNTGYRSRPNNPAEDQVQISYGAPFISSVLFPDCEGEGKDCQALTSGTQVVTLSGQNFDFRGEGGEYLEVSYGRYEDSFQMYSCVVQETTYDRVECQLAPGSGEDLSFKVINLGPGRSASDPVEYPVTISYAPPKLTSITSQDICEQPDVTVCEGVGTGATNVLTLHGQNFDGLSDKGVDGVTVTYGQEDDPWKPFTMYTCTVLHATDVAVECMPAAGSGNDLTFQISNRGPGISTNVPSDDLVSMSYGVPIITSLSSGSSCQLQTVCENRQTSGDDLATIAGVNFDARDQYCVVSYGTEDDAKGPYSMYTCSIVRIDTEEIVCQMAPGSGEGLFFLITNQGPGKQTNDVDLSPYGVSYGPPRIEAVSSGDDCTGEKKCRGLSTAGGTRITLTGDNFDPREDGKFTTVTYTRIDRDDDPVYVCHLVSLISSELVCELAIGSGTNLDFTVQNHGPGSQSSEPKNDRVRISYGAPRVDSVSYGSLCRERRECEDIPTEGGASITLHGKNFDGSDSPNNVRVTYGSVNDDPSPFGAYKCAPSFVSADKIVCKTAAGSGKEMSFKVINAGAGNQGNSPSMDRVSVTYSPPQLSSVEWKDCHGQRFCTGISTAGEEFVTLFGSNFDGLLDPTRIAVSYGKYSFEPEKAYNDFACSVRELTTTSIVCQVAEGVGRDLVFKVGNLGVGVQTNDPPKDRVRITYGGPAIESFTGINMLAMSVTGGQHVTIHGHNFGSVARNAITDVTYGQDGKGYSARDCKVTVDHTEIECDTTPGSGRNLAWIVTIDGQASPLSSALCSYHVLDSAPTIDAITSTADLHALNTRGGEVVTLTGQNYPTIVENLLDYVTYGPSGTEYEAADCAVSIDSLEVQCTTVAGIGASHRWIMSVGRRTSSASFDTTSYARPTIGQIVAAKPYSLDTSGGEVVSIIGDNFGSVHANAVTKAEYGVFDGSRWFTTTSCIVKVDNTAIECQTVEGSGTNHGWRVTIDNQVSEPLEGATSYGIPMVSSVATVGCSEATSCGGVTTDGEQLVTLTGKYFDATDSPRRVSVQYGREEDAFSQYTCVVKSVSFESIQCKPMEGSGTHLLFLVTNAGPEEQLSLPAVDLVSFSYGDPVIEGITYSGPRHREVNETKSCSNVKSCSGFSMVGSSMITLNGRNFDPTSSSSLNVTYGTDADNYEMHRCSVTSVLSDTVICRLEAGNETALAFKVVNSGHGSQQNDPASNNVTMSYYVPPEPEPIPDDVFIPDRIPASITLQVVPGLRLPRLVQLDEAKFCSILAAGIDINATQVEIVTPVRAGIIAQVDFELVGTRNISGAEAMYRLEQAVINKASSLDDLHILLLNEENFEEVESLCFDMQEVGGTCSSELHWGEEAKCQRGAVCSGGTCVPLEGTIPDVMCPESGRQWELNWQGYYCSHGTAKHLRDVGDYCAHDSDCGRGTCDRSGSRPVCLLQDIGDSCVSDHQCVDGLFCNANFQCDERRFLLDLCDSASSCGPGLSCVRRDPTEPLRCQPKFSGDEGSYCYEPPDANPLKVSDSCQWGLECINQQCQRLEGGSQCSVDEFPCNDLQYCGCADDSVEGSAHICHNMYNHNCKDVASDYAQCLADNMCFDQWDVLQPISSCSFSNCVDAYSQFHCCIAWENPSETNVPDHYFGQLSSLKLDCGDIFVCLTDETPDGNTWKETRAGATISLPCQQGWSGMKKRTCGLNSVWEDVDESECTQRICVAEGDWPATKSGLTAHVPCGKDFRGNLARKCQLNGLWDIVDDSFCDMIVCDGDEIWPDTPAEHSTTVNCPLGFSGNRTRECSIDGFWNIPDETRCTQIRCPVDGAWVEAKAGESRSLPCTDGYSGNRTRTCGMDGSWGIENTRRCERIRCPEDGEWPLLGSGKTSFLPCHEGFHGTMNRECSISGVWLDPDISNCTQMYCPSDDVWAKTPAGENTHAPCGLGFDGQKERSCHLDGVWGKVDESHCGAVVCSEEGDWPETLAGKVASVECGLGLSGEKTRKCTLEGEWGSPDITQCSELRCHAVGPWPVTVAGQLATVDCPPGYSGNRTRECHLDGEWEAIDHGACFQNLCEGEGEWPLTMANGIAMAPCLDGFAGNRIRKCSADGDWEAIDDSHCGEVICDHDGIWPETIRGRTAYIDCGEGMSGKKYRDCSDDGLWEAVDTSECTHIQCDADGLWPVTKSGNIASLPCSEGFSGTMTRDCHDDGVWGRVNKTACGVITCRETRRWPETVAGETVMIPCRDGWDGDWVRTCLEDGTWGQTDKSDCERNYCPETRHWPETGGGSDAVIPCRKGWAGNWVRHCDFDGFWETVDKSNCSRLYCPDAHDMWPLTVPGHTAVVPCREGFIGNWTRACLFSGEWGPIDKSNCHEILCNADGKYPETHAGHTVTVPCDHGWEGEESRECLLDGAWSVTDQSRCTHQDACPSDGLWLASALDDVEVMPCPITYSGNQTRTCMEGEEGVAEWSVVDDSQCEKLYCKETKTWAKTPAGEMDYAPCRDDSVGNRTRICNSDGTWAKTDSSQCVGVTCAPILTQGWPELSPGETAGIACSAGGYKNRTCLSGGVWGEVDMSHCVYVHCEGDGTWPDTEEKTTATLPCPEGYEGVVERECRRGGRWSWPDDEGCEISSAGVYCEEEDGWPRTHELKLATIDCPPGYLGNQTRECRRKGRWSFVDQEQCQVDLTAAFCEEDNGWPRTVELTTAVIDCPPGYTGTMSRACRRRGRWSFQDDSSCEVDTNAVWCEADEEWPRTAAGGVADAACPAGYMGLIHRECRRRGRWSFEDDSECEVDPNALWCEGSDEWPTTPEYATAQVACPAGFVGVLKRQCRRGGRWSFSDDSGCELDPNLVYCEAEDHWPRTPEQGVALLACPAGYTGSITRQCRLHGRWAFADDSECALDPDAKWCEADGDWPKTVEETIVELACPPFYLGSRTRECRRHGRWSWEDKNCTLDEANAVFCEAEGDWPRTLQKNEATLPCDEGFIGEKTRECRLRGRWAFEDLSGCSVDESALKYCGEEDGWAKTLAGERAQQECPEGYSGEMTRLCKTSGDWSYVNKHHCIEQDIHISAAKIYWEFEVVNYDREQFQTDLLEALHVTSPLALSVKVIDLADTAILQVTIHGAEGLTAEDLSHNLELEIKHERPEIVDLGLVSAKKLLEGDVIDTTHHDVINVDEEPHRDEEDTNDHPSSSSDLVPSENQAKPVAHHDHGLITFGYVMIGLVGFGLLAAAGFKGMQMQKEGGGGLGGFEPDLTRNAKTGLPKYTPSKRRVLRSDDFYRADLRSTR